MHDTRAELVPASDDEFAAEVAAQAGELLLAIRAGGPSRDLGDRGDRESNRLLVDAIRARYRGDAILSEEAADDLGRLSASRVWIIDPLDGTREFSEGTRSDWAVHVALWVDGNIDAAAVAIPARGVVLSTTDPPLPRPSDQGRRRRLLVSRTRPPEAASRVAEAIDAELVPMGSAGAKTAAVVLGEADAYLHSGGQYEWDSAAPAGVAAAAGLHTSRINGDPLRYNQSDPMLPDLLICTTELAMPILQALAQTA